MITEIPYHRSYSGIGNLKGAKWESGLDNSPMYDDAVYDRLTHQMLLADVGLVSLYINDCRSLSEIAAVLGKTEVEQELVQRAAKYSVMLETLWDAGSGLYLNRDLLTGEFSRRLSPTLFYPLLGQGPGSEAGRADDDGALLRSSGILGRVHHAVHRPERSGLQGQSLLEREDLGADELSGLPGPQELRSARGPEGHGRKDPKTCF
ncbi:MAG: alpha,alpha-trehalase [Marinilabiliales bacterium]|nr:alpha,alpha-trehalase [Marinilabiliales bacterium]